VQTDAVSTYSVVGLGKLGASMAAAIASRGFDVIGVDVTRRAVELVNAGRAPVQETGLEELVAANRDRLRATLSHEEAILESDLTFVIVPTPSDEQGAFSLQYAAWAFQQIGHALEKKSGYHTVVLTSTVLPGSTRHGLLPILEAASGKRCGADFGLCYSPEFIALGSVIHDFLNPDFTLIGEYDERAGRQLEACYAAIMANHPPCKRMSLENAELAKISINAFITTKITFANMLADLCERLPGGDVDVVSDALGMDSRIGRKYLTGALGYGGPCFPRDNVALGYIARALGSRAALAETTDQMNRSLAEQTVERLRPLIHQGATVAVLGLAYKPDSHVVEESQGIYLANALSRAGARIVAYDPLAGPAATAELHGQVVVLDSPQECLGQADVVLITTPDPAFACLSAADFAARGAPVTVIDFWRLLKAKLADAPSIRYVGVGTSTEDEANRARLAALWSAASAAGEAR
jgi:UDPglucose 6-dehydrogenase